VVFLIKYQDFVLKHAGSENDVCTRRFVYLYMFKEHMYERDK